MASCRLAAWMATAIIYFLGSKMADRLGSRGLIAIKRLIGVNLVAMAIPMFWQVRRITLQEARDRCRLAGRSGPDFQTDER